MKAPRSFIILVILQAIQSLSLLGLGLFRLVSAPAFQTALFQPEDFSTMTREFLQDILGLGITTISAFLVGIGLLFLILSMLRRRWWAWTVSMMIQGMFLAVLLFGYTRGQQNFALMFLGILLVFYLNDGEVQEFLQAKSVG